MSEMQSRVRATLPTLPIPLYRLGDFVLAGAFVLLTAARVLATVEAAGDSHNLEALHHASTGVFTAICALLFLWRGPARGRSTSIIPKVVAVVGTWSIVPLLWQPIIHEANWVLLVSSLGILASNGFIIWAVLTLRRNLSIFPEARELVRHGPYGLIRHPLYAAHILTYALVLLPRFAPLAIAFAVLGIAGEVWRARNEEAVLGAAFPAYVEYAAATPRFIPRLTSQT